MLFGGRAVGAIWYEGPALAVGPDGRAHVVMEPKDNSGIRYQGQVMQGGSPIWRDNYANLTGTALSPRVAVGPDNSVHIVHRGQDNKAYYGAMRSGFSGWTALEVGIRGAASVGVGQIGRAHV